MSIPCLSSLWPCPVQAFWVVHVTCASAFLLAVIVHDPPMAYHALPFVLVYMVDCVFRRWQAHTNITLVPLTRGAVEVQGNILTLRTVWHTEVGGLWRSRAPTS